MRARELLEEKTTKKKREKERSSSSLLSAIFRNREGHGRDFFLSFSCLEWIRAGKFKKVEVSGPSRCSHCSFDASAPQKGGFHVNLEIQITPYKKKN